MTPVKCLLIDDNELDRLIIEDYISGSDELQLLGSFENPVESLQVLTLENIGVLFLDIDMPVIDGINFFKKIEKPPLCVFVTAFPDYAVDAFDVHAVDYLLKPVKFERFKETVKRIREIIDLNNKAALYTTGIESNFITIKEGNSINKVAVGDIILLEALANWTKVITATKKYITLFNLKNFLQELPADQFLRVNRSYAVAKSKISKFRNNQLQLGEYTVPVGKTYRQNVIKFVSGET